EAGANDGAAIRRSVARTTRQEACALGRGDGGLVEAFKRSPPTGIWIGADEHHAFEPVAVKRRRPKNSARVVDIFDDIFTREPIRQKVAPTRRGRVACDLVTPPAGDRDARPPAVFRRDYCSSREK